MLKFQYEKAVISAFKAEICSISLNEMSRILTSKRFKKWIWLMALLGLKLSIMGVFKECLRNND
jgi:hypothetical protein